jgi:hypothetical protein
VLPSEAGGGGGRGCLLLHKVALLYQFIQEKILFQKEKLSMKKIT